MSGAAKRRELDIQEPRESGSEPEDPEDEEEQEELADDEQGMEIQVDFEGRNPQDPDYHGIKTLLQQLFLKAHLDIGSLTDFIISQNYIGSVVKQAGDDDNVSDDEDDNAQDVFGITTVINISERQVSNLALYDKINLPCIKQLRELLKQYSADHAPDAVNTMIKSVLENDSAPLGLLINERFINIPAQISVPLLENLISEMRRATNKKMPYDFSYLIMICKLKKANEDSKKTKSKNKKKQMEEPSIIWDNPEEEIFAEEAVCSFEFSVETESDKGLTGSWTEDDNELVPYRRVLLFEASKLQNIIEKVKSKLA